MGRRKKGEPPPYLLDRSTGQAYATVGGVKSYFGEHGSQESRYRYQRFLKAWERTHGAAVVADAGPDDGTIRVAVKAYVAKLQGRLSPKEYADTKRNLESLVASYGHLQPDDFRPPQYEALRESWLASGHHKTTVAKACSRVRRFFRWCFSTQRCEHETYGMLLAVMPLAPGEAPENDPIEPVPPGDFGRALRKLGRHTKAMALIQFLAGPRPGEVCRMRGCELHRSGTLKIGRRQLKIPPNVWLFTPEKHKGQKRKKVAVYVLGPKAQRILAPFLRDDPGEHLFQPKEARAEWEEAKRAARKTKVQPSQADRSKKRPLLIPGACYSVSSYGRAIERACARAGVPHWNPHALRHNFVTRMDAAAGLVISSTAVNHSQLETTLIYLEKKIKDVASFAEEIG